MFQTKTDAFLITLTFCTLKMRFHIFPHPISTTLRIMYPWRSEKCLGYSPAHARAQKLKTYDSGDLIQKKKNQMTKFFRIKLSMRQPIVLLSVKI